MILVIFSDTYIEKEVKYEIDIDNPVIIGDFAATRR